MNMRFHTGHYVSGAGHIFLIGWILFGGMFDRPSEADFTVADVSILSEDEFAALSQPNPTPAPETAEDVTEPAAPESAEAPATPAADPPTETPATPESEAPAPPDEAPDLTEIEPLPQPEVNPDAPITPEQPSTEGTTLVAPDSTESNPQPIDRVAPEAAPEPEPDVEISDTVQEAVTPDESAETPQEEQEATAEEEAATAIVTEAEESEEPVSSAPLISRRPPDRPERPVETAVVETPVETPTETPAETPTETSDDPLASAIGDAVSEAVQSDAPATDTSSNPAPSGPPMTGGEKDALRLAVQECWNVGSLSSEALRTTVVVSVSMARDGKPVSGSIRMLSSVRRIIRRGAASLRGRPSRSFALRCPRL